MYTFLQIGKSVYSKLKMAVGKPRYRSLSSSPSSLHMTVDEIINYEGDIPGEVTLQDKTAIEQNRLFEELDEEDRQTVLKIVDKMLTTKNFNQFFKENISN